MNGLRCGDGGFDPISVFADERGSTTVAAAVAVLVSLALVFCLADVQWSSSRSADVQAVADAGALAGMNVVAGYVTVAQVVDALILSMGLIGMLALALGLVLSAIPFADVAGPPVMQAAMTVLETRTSFSKSANAGLKKLEAAVPYMVAANAYATVRSNSGPDATYVGIAVPYPQEGESWFEDLTGEGIEEDAASARDEGERIDELSEEMEKAQADVDDALARGWLADSGGATCMYERARALAGMTGPENPYYPTTDSWGFGIPILRARAYYQTRIAIEGPDGPSPLDATRSAARLAFYRYALSELNASSCVDNGDGTVSCDLRPLPANTADVRGTSLYVDQIWPCTFEDGMPTIHSYSGCPGATGAPCNPMSVAELEVGYCVECPICQFSVVDLGRAPAASTSIENGFEHYWALVVEASRDYEQARNAMSELERGSKQHADSASDAFGGALTRLATARVELSPPGRYGCVCIAFNSSRASSPLGADALIGHGVEVPPSMAVSSAVLARDSSSGDLNVLSGFFDDLVGRGGFLGGASSVLDAIMSAWGDLLGSYNQGYADISSSLGSAFSTLTDIGLGGVAKWLRGALVDAVELTGFKPIDLTQKKPVLVSTADVMNKSGNDWYGAVRAMVVAMQVCDPTASPASLLASLGVYLETYTGEETITVAEVPIPGTELTIPLELDLKWLQSLAA